MGRCTARALPHALPVNRGIHSTRLKVSDVILLTKNCGICPSSIQPKTLGRYDRPFVGCRTREKILLR